MKHLLSCLGTGALSLILAATAAAYPTIFPRGTTLYDPHKAWGGYTVITCPTAYAGFQSSYLIDMNGNKVHEWNMQAHPIKVYPNGVAVGGANRGGVGSDHEETMVMDFDSNILWSFKDYDDADGLRKSRQHHDFQVNGSATGYYTPTETPDVLNGRMLILGHKNLTDPRISPHELLDDAIYEVDMATGKVVWQILTSQCFDQLGFDDDAKKAIAGLHREGGWDWLHVNSVSYLGPNKWWDEDPVKYAAFNPENLIWDARAANIIVIMDRQGNIVWRLGPDYKSSPTLRNIGQIVGQHNAHMIPRGLPGEGNILLFDNGGLAGYGAPTPDAPWGDRINRRDYSRVLEIDPVAMKVVWSYDPISMGNTNKNEPILFYSPYISNAQRLPNGNTMIVEGACARIFEVTPAHEIVWEHIGPAAKPGRGATLSSHNMYRAMRIPYEWIPQLKKPVEKAVVPAPAWDSRLPYRPE